MKKVFIAVILILAVAVAGGTVWVSAHEDVEMSSLEWAKEELVSDERYKDKDVMLAVIPVEGEVFKDGEASYIVIVITEDEKTVMDYYGVYTRQKREGQTVAREDVFIDIDLFKTEVFE